MICSGTIFGLFQGQILGRGMGPTILLLIGEVQNAQKYRDSKYKKAFSKSLGFLMQSKDRSFRLHSVPPLVVINSFKIPSHRAPQIHKNTSKCCPSDSCLVSIICIKHFCIFIVSDHKTMAVGDNIYYKGEQMQGTEKKRPYFYVRQIRRLATL